MDKVCKKCGFTGPKERFALASKTSAGTIVYRNICKKCHNKKRDSRKRVKLYDPVKERSKQLRKKYNMSIEDYNELLKSQENRCAICYTEYTEDSKAFAVDHCHKTSKIRGILCAKCNTALGLFKDSTSVLYSAIQYLEKK